jgi:hypothetical protein
MPVERDPQFADGTNRRYLSRLAVTFLFRASEAPECCADFFENHMMQRGEGKEEKRHTQECNLERVHSGKLFLLLLYLLFDLFV